MNRLLLNRHVGQGRPGFPQADEALAGQERAGTGIRAGHESGSRRPGTTSQQEHQRGRTGSRSERSEEDTSTHHGDPRAGLSCPGGQFAPRNVHLLAGYHRSHLFNTGHGHHAAVTPGCLPLSMESRYRRRRTRRSARPPPVRGRAAPRPTTTSAWRERLLVSRRLPLEAEVAGRGSRCGGHHRLDESSSGPPGHQGPAAALCNLDSTGALQHLDGTHAAA
jgi:hypothetical protein